MGIGRDTMPSSKAVNRTTPKFYEVAPLEALPINAFDKDTEAADVRLVTFELLYAGKGYVAKVITGNPNNLPKFKATK